MSEIRQTDNWYGIKSYLEVDVGEREKVDLKFIKTQDIEPFIIANKRARDENHGKFWHNGQTQWMKRAMSIPLIEVEKLKNKYGFDLYKVDLNDTEVMNEFRRLIAAENLGYCFTQEGVL